MGTRWQFFRERFDPAFRFLMAAWALLGALALARDEFTTFGQYHVLQLLPHWPWYLWAAFGLFIVVFSFLEGAYRLEIAKHNHRILTKESRPYVRQRRKSWRIVLVSVPVIGFLLMWRMFSIAESPVTSLTVQDFDSVAAYISVHNSTNDEVSINMIEWHLVTGGYSISDAEEWTVPPHETRQYKFSNPNRFPSGTRLPSGTQLDTLGGLSSTWDGEVQIATSLYGECLVYQFLYSDGMRIRQFERSYSDQGSVLPEGNGLGQVRYQIGDGEMQTATFPLKVILDKRHDCS